MMLPLLIAVLFFGGCAAWLVERKHPDASRWAAITALIAEALLVVRLYGTANDHPFSSDHFSTWFADFNRPWISRFGIGFHLAADGLSLLLIALTVLLGFMAVSSSWTEIRQRQGFFYFNLLTCLAGTIGVFLAADLFLFFFFWELMIIPMYFLISIWGHENRTYAAIKFFIFTQVSSLMMLLAMVLLVLVNQRQTGYYTFDYFTLLKTTIDPDIAFWLMLGFFMAFTVKLPVVPFHTWLPDAHTQAPTGGSVILAGVLLKTGAYGLLRLVIPLFPEAAFRFAPVAMALGTVSVIYAALMAYAQTDLKRLIAYTSVSHMGFILLGVFSWTLLGLQGSVVTMLAHGLSAAALFMIAGALQQRLHTRELENMGGLWALFPKLSALTLFFAMASLGLPGLANFIGEFLVLLGVYKVNVILAATTAVVLILAPVYSLLIIQKALHGPVNVQSKANDFNRRELTSLALLVLATLWIGLFPQTILNVSEPPLKQYIQNIAVTEER